MVTDQFDDLDEYPVVGGVGHHFEEDWCQRKIVPRVLTSQLTDHTHRGTLNSSLGYQPLAKGLVPQTTVIGTPASIA